MISVMPVSEHWWFAFRPLQAYSTDQIRYLILLGLKHGMVISLLRRTFALTETAQAPGTPTATYANTTPDTGPHNSAVLVPWGLCTNL